ncbi:hypothetical protein ABIB15_001490 [Marisediminicola sp. UYEF4]|uniref:hypothetical protein n=1 Tax=Marisediminicola sp. UYEF4 TaxID=1756384 RepID=UPI0033926E58
MSRLDIETKRKLREMGVTTLLDAFDAQDDFLTLGAGFRPGRPSFEKPRAGTIRSSRCT